MHKLIKFHPLQKLTTHDEVNYQRMINRPCFVMCQDITMYQLELNVVRKKTQNINVLYGIKCGHKFLSFCHNAHVWQTYGRTDRKAFAIPCVALRREIKTACGMAPSHSRCMHSMLYMLRKLPARSHGEEKRLQTYSITEPIILIAMPLIFPSHD